MKPPSGGPITGPTSAGIETQAMASISARLSTERISTRRPTGVIIAPPIPCTMRATTKSVSEEDAAQPIEPSTNTTIAARNTVRPPNRSAVQPLIGMNTATGGHPHDLPPRRTVAAARAPAQRAAVLGGAQPRADRPVPDLRSRLSHFADRSLASRHHRRAHEARGPQASRDRRCDRAPRSAAGLFALSEMLARAPSPLAGEGGSLRASASKRAG